MLHLISGISNKRKEYIANFVNQHKISPIHIYDNDIVNTDITELVSTQTSLFGDKELYVIHDLARNLELKSILPSFAESENIIIFSEESVTKPITATFEKNKTVVKDFGKEVKAKEKGLPVFNLADELGKRDKKNLWLLFQELVTEVSPEEIHGILFWQIKNMMLVKTSKENPGLAPFVYTKNKNYANNYSAQELKDLSQRFTHIFHTRDSYSTLDIEIEKIILSL
tara:strand:- start:183 stop:860 length:678 start_codon:yes stop_codon:yes gene_type:complete